MTNLRKFSYYISVFSKPLLSGMNERFGGLEQLVWSENAAHGLLLVRKDFNVDTTYYRTPHTILALQTLY